MTRSAPPPASEPDHPYQQKLQQLADQLGQIGFALPGSFGTRVGRCGKPTCRCHRDPAFQHGPYSQWTRKVAGKTVTRTLTEEQLRRYQPWADAHRELRKLLKELEDLSVLATYEAEGWPLVHINSQKTPAS